MAPSAIVFLCLLALASATPLCSTSCDASSKSAYTIGKTYTYEYTGWHELWVEGVLGGSTKSDYSATVSLTGVSPCDVAISLQNVAGSSIAGILERQVEKYPLMVSVNNGKVEKVCSHPEDDISSINVKKAIASAFQNVLPTLEPTPAKQIIKEDDIFGICPTKYTVVTEGDKTIVTKRKKHSDCQEHHYTQTRASFLPSKTPLPIQDSRSSCHQVITNGIYSTIRCTETKYITPGFGMFKFVLAEQDFTLRFVSESADTSAVSSIEGQELNSQSLSYQQELPIKNPALVPKVDAIMPEICTLSQGQGNKQVASLVAQSIELLRFVPDDAVVEVLDKIRAGQYCADFTKLESLFLDAVAFVGEPGAFKVMAQEIAAGRTTGGRFSLYTVAVNLLTRPTLKHVAALKPIFGMTNSNQLLSLAASTVVNRYCTQNADCDQTAPVKEILKLLSAKLLTQCTPEFSNAYTTEVLITLACFGNIGKVFPDLLDDVMKCASTEGIDTTVQFAATMSLKGLSCSRPVTDRLKSVVLDASMNTVVRFGSYLAAVRCADANDLEEVINAMSSESNKQVQGFILSHLENLQETNWPLKQNLHEILASKNIPNDYIRNIFKYSRNIEMSVNAPIIELGGLVESNIVYTPESYVPRLVNLGLNMNLLGSFINIGEVGAIVEGFDPYIEDALGPNSYLYKEVFGPDSYLYKTPLWSIIEDSKLFMTHRGTAILQQIQQLIRENNINPDMIIKTVNKLVKDSKNINADYILKAFNKVLNNAKNIDIQSELRSVDFDSIIKSILTFLKTNKFQLPRTDLYAILRAQERAFLSFGGEKNQFTINELAESVISVIMNALAMAQDLNVDTTRTGQINIDYSLPTMSGIPLKLKLTGTGVAGIQLKNNLNVKEGAVDALLKIIPSLSAQIEGQIGFGELLNTGLKLRSSAYTTNGFALNVVQKNGEDLELQLELPEKMDFFDIETETFFMKLDKDTNEVKVFPMYMQDTRIASNQCSGIIEPVTGLLVCYNINVPDLLNNNRLPFGKPMTFRVYLEKSDATLKGYRLAAKLKNKPNNKMLKIAAGTYGLADSKESTLSLSYTKEQDTYSVATNFQSTLLENTCELTFSNQPEYKSLQYYTSGKIGRGIEVEGSVKLEFKPVVVSNGNTYEIATYAGLTKSLNEKHRLFQVSFYLLENGEKTAAKFLTKTDILPATFEAGIELPSNAGLRIYKVESITMRSTISSIEIEALLLKKSSEVYQTILNIKKSGSALATFDAINTISIESPLTGFNAIKLKLMTTANAKLPMVELGVNSKLTYENGVIEGSARATYFDTNLFFAYLKQSLGFTSPALELQIEVPVAELDLISQLGYSNGVIDGSSAVKYLNSEAFAMNTKLSYVNYVVEISSGVTYFSSKIFSAHLKQTLAGLPLTFQTVIEVPNVFLVDFSHTVDHTGLTTMAQVEAPALIKPLKVNNIFGISNAFSYSFLTDVTSGGSAILHVEGPLTFAFSRSLVQQNLDLKISGAFGTFNVIHGITLSIEKLQYTVDVRHTNTPIVFVDIVLDRTNAKEIAGKFNVNVPFVIESDLAATITTSLIHSTMKTLILPNTDYARRFKAYADFNWVENNFKGELYWDAEKNNDKKVGFTTKYALDTTALKFLLEGELTVTTLTYGYKLQSVIASPFNLIQSSSGLEFTVTLPSQKVAVAKTMLDIQYADDQLTLKPVIAFITIYENKYEISSTVVAKHLPGFLNFDVTFETTLSTPQLQQITLTSKLMHEDKDQSGKLAFTMSLKESILTETWSFEYILECAPSTFKQSMKVLYGPEPIIVGGFTFDIALNSGLQDFVVTQQLHLRILLIEANSLIVKLTKTADGTLSLAFMIDEEKILNLYYSLPMLTNHIVGIEIPSRTLEYNVVFSSNQVSFKIFPEKSKSDKVVETTLRLTPKASTVQFEALVTAPSISKEIRFAVELELIEPGKDRYDMISIDVQYQVYEAPKLLKATLNELESIFGDFDNDGLIPDFQEWTRQAAIRPIVGTIVFIFVVHDYYEDVCRRYGADLTPLWNKIHSGMLMYWNIIKTETPVLLKNYVILITKTEAWHGIQTTLEEVIVNYPAYYDAGVDFYKKVIVTYFTDLSEAVSSLFLLPEFDPFDLFEYVGLILKGASTILDNVVSQLPDTKALMLFQEKFNELKSLYPMELGLLEDFYTKVIFPTATDTVAVVRKLMVASNRDFRKYWNNDVPELFIKFSQRVLDTQVVYKLRSTYPAVFHMADDLYTKVVLPTFNDIIAFNQKVAALRNDYQAYWPTIQADLPAIATRFGQRLLDTQIVKHLRAAFPTVFGVVEDFYSKVILPTFEDILAVVLKIIPLRSPFFRFFYFQESIQQHWNVIKVEGPTLFSNFVQRLSNTQLMNELKTLLPTVYEVSEDFYKIVVLPTIDDVVAFVDKIVDDPVAGIQEIIPKYWNILKLDVPTLMINFLYRIPNTKLMNSSFLQNKFNELKVQYPEVFATGLDFYTKVVVPAINDVPMLYNKLIKMTDVYQLRDFLTTDVLSFVNNLLRNMNTTKLFNKLMVVFDQLAAAYPGEYNTILRIYNKLKSITVSNVISAINFYLFEKFGMSFSISAEKFTAVVPLPVSVATLHNYYQLITVYVPAYVIDILSQWGHQGHIVYQYIEARVPVVMDYINTQAPIYLQYVKDYVQDLQVVIPQFINEIEAKLPQYIEEAQAYLLPYVEEIRAMMETNYKIARESTYGKFAENLVRDVIEIMLIKFNEVIELYPEEIQAVKDFVTLYMNICLDYTSWVINTVFEHPTVQKIINYIITLTPEKAQADLTPLLDFAMAVLHQVEVTVNELITALPKEIPEFVKLHIPQFFLTFIESVINFLLSFSYFGGM